MSESIFIDCERLCTFGPAPIYKVMDELIEYVKYEKNIDPAYICTIVIGEDIEKHLVLRKVTHYRGVKIECIPQLVTRDEIKIMYLDELKANIYIKDMAEKQRHKRMMIETTKRSLEISDVIFNDPATIVFWVDGTKTVVKAVDEEFDPEKGLAMAISKKALDNDGKYYNEFKKWLPEGAEEC